MSIKGSVTFKCDSCDKQYKLGAGELEFQVAAVTEDKMGEHIHYVYEYESECDQCGKRIDIEFEVWEYPVGTLNHKEYSMSGAKDIEESFVIDHPKE